MTRDIKDIKRPERLFRYFSPRASHIFTEQKLWFSSAVDFNDIFEVVPRYDKLIPEMTHEVLKRKFAFLPPENRITFQEYERATRAQRRQIIEECNATYPDDFQEKFSACFGIVCFSENLDSLLMWGHYTDCHAGFVVEFNSQHPLFSPQNFGPVSYTNDRPVLTLTQEPSSEMLLCKSSEWSYECEHRLIIEKKELSEGLRNRNRGQVRGHFLPLPMDSVKAVYFGCRMLPEFRDHILKPLKKYPSVEIFCMRRNSIAYKLDAIPWADRK